MYYKRKEDTMNHNTIKKVKAYEKNGYVYIDFTVSGKRYRPSTGYSYNKKNLAYVEKNKYELAWEYFNSKMQNKVMIYFHDLIEESLQIDSSSRDPDTQLDYENISKHKVFKFLMKMDIRTIKPHHIEQFKQYLIELKLSVSRAKKYFRVLNFILDFAYKNDFIDSNPLKKVNINSKGFKKASRNNTKYYTPNEIKTILSDNDDPKLNVFVTIGAHTGMRSGEILSLKYSDCDFKNQTITVQRSIRLGIIKGTKTDETRVVTMSNTLKDRLLLFQQTAKYDWIFINTNTKKPYFSTKPFRETRFKKLLLKHGIEYKTLYALRHSFASNCATKNVPLVVIQANLGHKSIETTNNYLKNGLLDQKQSLEYINGLYE